MRNSQAVLVALMLAGALVLEGCTGRPLSTPQEGTPRGAALGAGTG